MGKVKAYYEKELAEWERTIRVIQKSPPAETLDQWVERVSLEDNVKDLCLDDDSTIYEEEEER